MNATVGSSKMLPLHLEAQLRKEQEQQQQQQQHGVGMDEGQPSMMEAGDSAGNPQDVMDQPSAVAATTANGPLVHCEQGLEQRLKHNEVLRHKLAKLRQQRAQLQSLEHQLDTSSQQLHHQLYVRQQEQMETCQRYHSVVKQLQQLHGFQQRAKMWNVLNDCFPIWHSGPFGTINGYRLGLEAPPMPAIIRQDFHGGYGGNGFHSSGGTMMTVSKSIGGGSPNANADSNASASASASNSSQSHPNQPPTQPRRYLFFSSSSASVAPEPATRAAMDSTTSSASTSMSPFSMLQAGNSSVAPIKTVPQLTMVTISWNEINAALGQVVFLLQILQERSTIRYMHDLHPMGSTSRIGIRFQSNAHKPSVYNLYYQDTSFSLFGRRNFNIALNAMMQCIHDAASVIHQRDRTIILPHSVQKAPSNEFRVGGLSVSYTGSNGVEWTRVMKYVLTNVKWLIAYSAKHVDV